MIPRVTLTVLRPSRNDPPSRPSSLSACRSSMGIDARGVAEAFRDLPGLALLESARRRRRPGWSTCTADPVAVRRAPAGRRARSPRLAGSSAGSTRIGAADRPAGAPPFLGGLVGYLGYEFGAAAGAALPARGGRPATAAAALGLHDWVVAWNARTGEAWLGGRASTATRARSTGASTTSASGSTNGRSGVGRGSSRATSAPDAARDALEPRPRAYSRPASSRIRAAIARRRALPGQPHPPPRDAVRRRSVAALPAPAARRPGAVRGVPRPGLAPTTGRARSCRPHPRRSSRWTPAASSRPTRSRARDPAAGTATRIARSPASSSQRQGPGRERDDRGRAPQRPRAGLRAGHRSACRGCAGSSGRPRSSTSSRTVRRSCAGRRRRSTCSRPRSPAARSPARRRSAPWSCSRTLEPVARGPYTGALGWIGPDGAMRPASSSGRSSPTAAG